MATILKIPGDWNDVPRIRTSKSLRKVKGYPKRAKALVHFHKRGAVKRELLRQERPRRHARPWKYRTTLDADAAMEARATQSVNGSLQERIFYQALVDYGFVPGVDFNFQSSQLGGRAELGGLVADFIFEVPRVIVQVQSVWHTVTLEHEVRDSDQAMILRSMGFIVLEIWPPTLEDPAALDYWIERNIMHLWGTSSQPLGLAGWRDQGYMEEVMFEEIERLKKDVEFLMQNVGTGFGLRLDKIENSIFSGATGTGLIVNSAAVAEYLKSTNYTPGVSGWRIDKTGQMELQQAIVRGTIFAAAGSFTGSVTVGSTPNAIIIDGPNKRIQSENYVAGTSGWRINGDGFAEFSGLLVPSANITGLVTVGTLPNVIYIDGLNKNIRSSNFATGLTGWRVNFDGSAEFQDATVRGTIFASSGAFTGTVEVGTAGNRIQIRGAQNDITSANYVVDTSGWRIDGSGSAEFENVTARGAIRSSVMSYQELQVTAGTQIIAKSGGVLAQAFTSAAGAGANRLYIKDPLVGAALLFGVGDILRIKYGNDDNWFQVTATGTGGGPADATHFYDATLVNGTVSTSFTIGSAVIDYGAAGSGYMQLVGDGAVSPSMRIVTHAGTPWATSTEYVRIGNLRNWGPIGAVDRFGAAFGDFASGNYTYFDPQTNLMRFVTAGGSVEMNATGIQMAAGTADKNILKWVSGATSVGKINTYFDNAGPLTRTNVLVYSDPVLTDLGLLWLRNGNTLNFRLEEDAGGSVARLFHNSTTAVTNFDIGSLNEGSSNIKLYGSSLTAGVNFPAAVEFFFGDGVYGQVSLRTNKVSGGATQVFEANGPLGVGFQMPVSGTYRIRFPNAAQFAGITNFTALPTFTAGLTVSGGTTTLGATTQTGTLTFGTLNGGTGASVTAFSNPMSATPSATIAPTEQAVQRFMGLHLSGCQGRLTPSASDPTPNTFNGSTTVIYLLPHVGDIVLIWDGTYWIGRALGSSGKSIAVPATTNTAYDVYAYWTGSAVALELLAWTNQNARATGITRTDGIWRKSTDQTRTYIGTISTGATSGQVPFTIRERFIWNQYNRIPIRIQSSDLTSHTYNSATRREYRGVTTLRLRWMDGNQNDDHIGSVTAALRANVVSTTNEVGIALNSPTLSGGILTQNQTVSQVIPGVSETDTSQLGLNTYYPFESASTSISTFSFARFQVLAYM